VLFFVGGGCYEGGSVRGGAILRFLVGGLFVGGIGAAVCVAVRDAVDGGLLFYLDLELGFDTVVLLLAFCSYSHFLTPPLRVHAVEFVLS
jgi:hypothetical protein